MLKLSTVKAPLANSRINWVYDSPPSQSHHIAPRQTLPTNKTHDKKARTNYSVPRNVYQPPQRRENTHRDDPIVPSSDVRVRTPLGNINSSAWHNSALSSRTNNCPPVHRNNTTDKQINVRETAPPPPKKKGIVFVDEREER